MSGTLRHHGLQIIYGLALSIAVLGAGCATVQEPAASQEPPNARDPWERYNRAIYRFNDRLDRTILKPITQGYQAITPELVETGVSNAFANLDDIRIGVNNLLQFKFKDAASDTGRLLVNTTVGVGGLIDVASRMGLTKHDEDFGQTLGYWGVASGPYLMLPFFGPSTVRDAPAEIPDFFLDPITYVEDNVLRFSLFGFEIIDTRAALLKAEEVVSALTYDRYTLLRDAYLDRRDFLVRNGQAPAEERHDDDELLRELDALELE